MSDELSSLHFDFDGLPETLELIGVVTPQVSEYRVDGYRVFVTAVEFWNTRTTFHLTWPVMPDSVRDLPIAKQTARGILREGLEAADESPQSSAFTIPAPWHQQISTAHPIARTTKTVALDILEGKFTIVLQD